MNEQQIETHFIEKLQTLKYSYRPDIRDNTTLEHNFRQHFQTLNQVQLTDKEFKRLLNQIISLDVFATARRMREHNSMERDDGTPLFYTLINLEDWCKNTFEVVNQLRINTRDSHHRYDVILLINGLPVVQIELKKLDISPRRAMQQIIDYKNDLDNGYTKTLLCFMQLFIVSNHNNTYYFTNNNPKHFSFNAEEHFLPIYQFADRNNKKVTGLDDFADAFLNKCALSKMIGRYMVLLAGEQKLLIMRPYQIYAVEAIVDCIKEHRGNGYIWHTTGSGKTLTSFKAATLLKDNPNIYKCLFVVDRKDLDQQTRNEFNKFQDKCVEENTNTETLVTRLLSEDYTNKIIVTTIQKLGRALNEKGKQNYKQRLKPLSNKRIVFIFDECHRSQFGDNHKAIKEFFPNAQLFGFTGTPIFEQNATSQYIEDQQAAYLTTDSVFQKQLHNYTITYAIEDKNVLSFHIDHYRLEGEDRAKPDATLIKRAVIEAILTKHDAVTNQRKFNALFATASINDAIEYYQLFKAEQAEKCRQDSNFRPLNIACIFSPPADSNEDLPQEKIDNAEEPEKKKAALTAIIADYNAFYGTNHSINEFDKYYQDVQEFIKDQQYSNTDGHNAKKVDMVIVVDMLLTGFDSKFLNTLYVDKNLKYHGLIQAFSRTNRVLNDTKPSGNIIDFRQQQDEVDEAVALFSGKDSEEARKIWLTDPAPVVIEKLNSAIAELRDFMELQGLKCEPKEIPNLQGDIARAQFVRLFKEVQRIKTQLDQYTDLTGEEETTIENLLPQEQLQGFKGAYLETAKRLRALQNASEEAPPEIEQLDFEFVLFASTIVDYDYIMDLTSYYSSGSTEMTREQLIALIRSEAKFIDNGEEIIAYINSLKVGEGLTKQEIFEGFAQFKEERYTRELAEIAEKHQLDITALHSFVNETATRFILDNDALSQLFTPLALGWKARGKAEQNLMRDLAPLFHKITEGRGISGLAVYE